MLDYPLKYKHFSIRMGAFFMGENYVWLVIISRVIMHVDFGVGAYVC